MKNKLDSGTLSMMGGMGIGTSEIKKKIVDPGTIEMMRGMGIIKEDTNNGNNVIKNDKGNKGGSFDNFKEILISLINDIKKENPIVSGIIMEYNIDKIILSSYEKSLDNNKLENNKKKDNEVDIIEEFLDC